MDKKTPGKVIRPHIEVEISAPADKAWEIVGKQFAKVSEYSKSVPVARSWTDQDVVPEGITVAPNAPCTGRICQLTRTKEVMEILTAYDDTSRSFTFVSPTTPIPFIQYGINKTQVVEITKDESCKIVTDLEIKLSRFFCGCLSGKLRKRMETSMSGPRGLALDVKKHCEEGME